jgi:hypothetical protein
MVESNATNPMRKIRPPLPIRMIEMIDWTIYLVALWLIWFWVVKQ